MSRIDEKRDLVTSKGILQYATSDLINKVAKYPVLWDRLHPEFKEGKAKEIVWHEINRVFVPFYDALREEEKATITNTLKTRWRNCISGLMNSVSQKQKNDRLFRPFKYAREMKFYLETRGVNFSDIYDSDHIDGMEDPIIKTESEEEVQPEPDDLVEQYTPKNKKAKTLNTTPTTYRSSRLREKQMILANKSAEKLNTKSPIQKVQQKKRRSTSLGNGSKKKKTTINNSQNVQPQIKRTPTSINTSVNNSVDSTSNTIEDVMESAGEEDVEEGSSNHYPEQQIYPREEPVFVNQISKPKTILNETEVADQAFFESIKPALRKMNEAQKLDFQIDVLQMLKTFQTN
ncbi:uncharacterized protein ACRADG_000697 isoform 1-T1 [Cochliomyia hominivorax]